MFLIFKWFINVTIYEKYNSSDKLTLNIFYKNKALKNKDIKNK